MKNKILFWATTGLLSLMMLGSVYAYFTSPEVIENFRKGFPEFFRIELGLAKLLGVLVLLVPAVPRLLKEWAYAGFGITFISATIMHISLGDPFSAVIMPMVALLLLIVSRVYAFRPSSKDSV
jgi:VIT1/CCC1 family predicted Fe2+/Mn2+ transporter